MIFQLDENIITTMEKYGRHYILWWKRLHVMQVMHDTLGKL